jgi:uracil-DNA glycosylase
VHEDVSRPLQSLSAEGRVDSPKGDRDMTTDRNDARSELSSIAASLRAYLEWQEDTGARGIPRGASPMRARATRSAVVEEAPARAEAQEATRVVEAPAKDPVLSAPAASARPLPVLEGLVKECRRCGLAGGRTQTVFARGNPAAALCFIGEAPGADEDAQGLPFVGRAGQLLDRMIQAMGLDPASDVYVCNIIKCRPPGNRRPEPDEIDQCIPFLHEQIESVAPKAIVALGNTAVSALLGTKLGITKVRGNWKLYKGTIPVMPTYHPSYLIRPSAQQAEAKRQAWDDLKAVMKLLGLELPKK